MPSEMTRHRLYEEVREVLSPESADELMGYLPPVGWADVATKADIGTIRTEMDALRAELRGELKSEIGGVKSEIGGLKRDIGELKGEITGIKGQITGIEGQMTGLRSEIGGLRGELKAEISDGMRHLHWWILGSNVSVGALVLAAVRFGA